jgi:hypothetical protein
MVYAMATGGADEILCIGGATEEGIRQTAP